MLIYIILRHIDIPGKKWGGSPEFFFFQLNNSEGYLIFFLLSLDFDGKLKAGVSVHKEEKSPFESVRSEELYIAL